MPRPKNNTMFTEFIKRYALAKGSGKEHTHTRIGDSTLSIYGGSYLVPDDEHDAFMENYYEHVFVKGMQEYLTEKQMTDNGPILIDLDLRYPSEIESRQHTDEHVLEFVNTCMNHLKDILDIPDKAKVPVFVQEKPNVVLEDTYTKDGIHIIIGIACHKAVQLMLRERMIEDFNTRELWSDLMTKFTNTSTDIYDESVVKGHANWTLYGSRKPGCKVYTVTQNLLLNYHAGEQEWSIDVLSLKSLKLPRDLKLLSARYTGYKNYPITDESKEEYERTLASISLKKKQKPAKGLKLRIVAETEGMSYDAIDSMEKLDAVLEGVYNNLDNVKDYALKEVHDYCMLLTEEYYGPQSYNKWIRVGWALKNTSRRLFPTWLKFSAQDNCRNTLRDPLTNQFDWSKVPELLDMWNGFADTREDGLTSRSVRYWAQQCNPEAYEDVRRQTIDFFIEETLKEGPATATEYDLANVLYNLFKDRFVCVSIKHKGWYEFVGHRWIEVDSGSSLRMLISKDLHDVYTNKTREAINAMHTIDHADDRWSKLQKRSHKLAEICIMLKTTKKKDNIMREASELFYDMKFMESLNTKTHLLCFNNGVVDFQEKCFRRGLPDDYISKSTNIDYIPLSKFRDRRSLDEVTAFIKCLFPDPELEQYVWQFLSSICIGGNENQTFNIWLGTGANGKSKLVELLEICFGEYKGDIPVTLVTRERLNIGSTSSEVVKLIGTRLAVMAEPSKDEKINEGPMKDLTGGDKITARALFKDAITFVPQFKLVVCTNVLPEIKTQDDGTWRRIKVVDFDSKFIDKPYQDEVHYPRERYPYQYPVDKKINKKFEKWAPALISKLVSIAYDSQGLVEDCSRVTYSSDRYREGQDYFLEFVKENIERSEGDRIQKCALGPRFRSWWQENHGRGIPKSKELHMFMEKRFGAYKNGWQGIRFIDQSEDAIEDINE